jgi:hypothetical protein
LFLRGLTPGLHIDPAFLDMPVQNSLLRLEDLMFQPSCHYCYQATHLRVPPAYAEEETIFRLLENY